jgi:signal transduction histidine kinase
MLDASHIRAEGISLTLDFCDLAAIVAARVKSTTERARGAGCAITVRGASSVVGRWDRRRVTQVVDELLDNAIKFGARAPIEIELSHDETEAVLSVRDYGPSIAPERLRSIFSPFERNVPKEYFGGLGLGLYIAKAIVEAHGGSIAASSSGRDGTTFVVRLPLGESGAGRAPRARAPVRARPRP